MQKVNDWDNVQESGNFRNLPAGGYVCRIESVKDEPQKQYLKVEYDIAQGDFKGYALDCETRNGFWPLTTIRSYKEKAIGFFKHFISAVEKSNSGYKWSWEEKTLEGKLIGMVIGEEEYEKRDGKIGTRMTVKDTLSIYDIKDGKYSIPEPVKIQRTEKPSVDVEVDDEDLPFDFN